MMNFLKVRSHLIFKRLLCCYPFLRVFFTLFFTLHSRLVSNSAAFFVRSAWKSFLNFDSGI
jgi:hypothetical protein